jgi:putative membrane protein
MLVVAGVAASVQSWFGWTRTERALRTGRALPSAGLMLPVVMALVAVGIVVIMGALL